MSTSRTFTYEYPAAPERVAELLRDPEFVRARCEAAGDRNIEIQTRELEGGVELTVSRERTFELPSFMRALASPAGRTVETTLWRRVGDGWQAQYSLEVAGIPAKLSGLSTYRPSQAGTHYSSTFEVSARVPLVARKVESLLAERFAEQLALIAARNAEALRGS